MSKETKFTVGATLSGFVLMMVILAGSVLVFWGEGISAAIGDGRPAWLPGPKPTGLDEAYNLVVDYDQPLAEAIAAGHYDFVNDNITEANFPSSEESGVKEVEVYLLHFNRKFANGDEALAEIDRFGYRPASIREFLALNASQPELTDSLAIAILGSVYFDRDENRRFVCVGGRRSLQRLGLGSFSLPFGTLSPSWWSFPVVPR